MSYIILMVAMEPDFGTAALLVLVSMIILLLGGVRIRYLSFLGTILLFFLMVLAKIEGYPMQRIVDYLNPWNDPEGIGYQAILSSFSFKDGGLFGVG